MTAEVNGTSAPWAKLISFGPGIENVNLSKNSYIFGRAPTVDVKIPDIKLSGQHCKIYKDEQGTYWVEDTSSNGTFIDNELIGKGKKKQISSGDKIYLLHQSKVKATEVIGYVFTVLIDETNELKRKREEEEIKSSLEQEKKLSEKQNKFQEELGEEMMCCICIDYIYNCVTAIPCLHNFCASCFSGWMEKSKMCPQCREEVTEIKKNALVNNILEKFMENNPSKKRSKEEYEEMDKANKIKEDKIVFKKAAPPAAAIVPQNRVGGVSILNTLYNNNRNNNTYNYNYNNRYGYNNRNYRGRRGGGDSPWGESENSDDYDPSEEEDESEEDSDEYD